jgi:hypothetical protein
MADDALALDQFETWLTPGDTLDRLSKILGSPEAAAKGIATRLCGSAIKSAARSSSWEGRSGTREGPPVDRIPPGFWLTLPPPVVKSLLWKTGDIHFYLGLRFGDTHTDLIAARYYGVRFDPVGIDTWIRDIPSPRPRQHHWRPKPKPEPEQVALVAEKLVADEAGAAEKPPVSQEHLRAWFELYRQIYTGSQDTEDNALKSAMGMFQGNSVARKRVRELRGPRPIGRKRRDSQG